MADHHERAVTAFVESARDRGAQGVIVVGSVARGTERPNSDVDLYELVADSVFNAALASGTLARIETEQADWPDGYLDIKLASPTLLRRAVDDADDATRASFAGARIALDRDGGLESLLAAVVAPGGDYFERHIAGFGAQFALHADYFLVHGREHQDPLLASSAAVHAAFAAGRMALASQQVLFRGPKYLDEQLRGAGRGNLASAAANLVAERTFEAVERVRALVPELSARAGQIDDVDLARFITDNEWAWFTGRTPPEYR